MNRKILLFQPYADVIGHFRFFFDLWRAHLIETGYEVTGLVGYATEPKIKPDTEYFVNSSEGKFTRILGTIKGFSQAFRLASDRNIPVIYIQDFEIVALSIAMWMNPRKVNSFSMVLHQHAGNFEVDRSDSLVLHLYRHVTKMLFKQLLARPNVRIIANGGYIAEALEQYTGIGAPTVVASTWGTTPGTMTAPKESTSFLFAGIIRNDKNLELVLASLAKHLDAEWTLIIAGRPFDYTSEQIHKLIREAGIPESRVETHLRFIPDEEWATFFSRSEYIFIPYKAYNKSNSGPLIDALQYECIPIVSDFGERGDLVKRFGIGYAFDFESRTLSELLKGLLHEDHDKTKVLRAIRTVKDDFTWPKILRDLTENHRIFEP